METRSRIPAAARTLLAFVLVIALSVAFVPSVVVASQDAASVSDDASAADEVAAAESTAVYEKTEVVYATLAADGAAESVYVVNRFDVTQAGTIVDWGAYSQVKNLTDTAELSREGDATVFEAQEGVWYYQGYTESCELPWEVQVVYELDGREVDAEELAGASGDLTIRLTTTRVDSDAIADTFAESFLLQVTFTLSDDVARDIQAEGATLASSGQDTTVTFTVLPGSDGDLTLSAQVSDFEMDGIQIAALPYSSDIDMPDTDELTDGMEQLADAVSQLSEGTASLSEGSESFADGLAQLDDSSSALVSASAQIESALEQVADGLGDADLSQLSSLSQLSELSATLTQLADGLDELQEQSAALQAGYAAAFSALDASIDAIPDATLTEEELATLYMSLGGGSDTLDELVESYEAAATVKGTWAAVEEAFEGASTLLDALAADDGALAVESAALRQMASALDGALGDDFAEQLAGLSQIGELAEGMEELADQYGEFHDGLAAYAEGVGTLASGAEELSDGTSELAEGTAELDESTSALPDEMGEQIDELMADYDFPAFEPTSFVSADNGNVTAVQFVLVTEAVEVPEEEAVEEEEAEETFFDRLLALF